MDRNDNSKGRKVSYTRAVYRISRDTYFKLGYEDARKHRPYNYDIENKAHAIHYERGRAFAIWALTAQEKSSRWKNGVLSCAGQERLLRAMYQGAVI